ncbi:hypothetical protein WMY93_001165 [Mugilogobius chulae]|uniref:Microtubule-associated protein 4 n=1 Tax=Mugilogobius chulae TaxID=88201 RepID=A0AAW0Q4K6_9GOBI
MDLSLRDALGGGGGGVPGGAPADALLKRDFMSTLEKEPFDDKVGETVAKSDYRPLLDGKDPKCGPGMMSSIMSTGGRQDPPGQPAFSSDYLTVQLSDDGRDGGQWSPNKPKDSSVPDSFLGFSQSGLGGTGGGVFKPSEPLSTGGTGLHSMDHTTVKSDNKDKQDNNMSKMETLDKKEEQQKKDNIMEKNQKILKEEEKNEKLNADKNNKVSEKAEKVDNPRKRQRREERSEERGGEESWGGEEGGEGQSTGQISHWDQGCARS